MPTGRPAAAAAPSRPTPLRTLRRVMVVVMSFLPIGSSRSPMTVRGHECGERLHVPARLSIGIAGSVTIQRVADAFFLPDGDGWLATSHTRGPWSPAHQHGGPPAALIAHALEAAVPEMF